MTVPNASDSGDEMQWIKSEPSRLYLSSLPSLLGSCVDKFGMRILQDGGGMGEGNQEGEAHVATVV
jgi:hypothetical protein